MIVFFWCWTGENIKTVSLFHLKIIHIPKPLEENKLGKLKKSKRKINQTLRRNTMKPNAVSCPLRAGLIASEVAQRPRAESHRLSPRSHKARPSLPVHGGRRSMRHYHSLRRRILKESSLECSKILPLPCGEKTLVRGKPRTLAGLEQCQPPHAGFSLLEGECWLLHNYKGKDKASAENARNWAKMSHTVLRKQP